jgi:hypothetical protein
VNHTLTRLRNQLKRHRITHDAVAAACTPTVHRTMVSKALNDRAKSARVVATARRLVLEAQLSDARKTA